MPDIDMILALIIKLLSLLKPSQLEKIKAEIERMEKDHAEKKKKFIAALAASDLAALNQLISELIEL